MFEVTSVTLPLPVPTAQFAIVWLIIGSLTAAFVMLPLYGAYLTTTEWDEDDIEYDVVAPRQDESVWFTLFAYFTLAVTWPIVWVELWKGEL